jgi:tetratricopeptide (TPR) repeat protein
MSKEDIKQKEKKLIEMVEGFTKKHVDNEYKELCIKLVKKLGRKHDVPFKRGKLEIWDSAVVYAIGQINFLFDKDFEPYVSPDEICDYFSTKKSTVADKAKKIRDMFKMGYYDEEFSTEDMLRDNPYNDLAMTEDGFIVPKSMLVKEESHVSLLSLIADKSGEDEETIIESFKNDFIEEHGDDFNNKELESAIEMLSAPVPVDIADELFNEMLNIDLDDESSSSFSGDDDIELFEDYVIDETNPLETIEDYQRAIDLFRDTKGEEYFEENKGYFWGMLETRPFMTHLMEQAALLWDDGQKEKAVTQLEYILELLHPIPVFLQQSLRKTYDFLLYLQITLI